MQELILNTHISGLNLFNYDLEDLSKLITLITAVK